MHVWQIQEAKAKLTQLLKDSLQEPQLISRRGIPETIVMSLETYYHLLGKKQDMVSFLKSSPLNELEIDVERESIAMRDVTF